MTTIIIYNHKTAEFFLQNGSKQLQCSKNDLIISPKEILSKYNNK